MFEFFGHTRTLQDGVPSYVGSYSVSTVIVSILIAIAASYVSFQITEKNIAHRSGASRHGWIALGSIALGSGVWSMHFIGMLAFQLPIEVRYDPTMTALSAAPAVMASAIALHTLSRDRLSFKRQLCAGILMGAGIGAMHYTGMMAMRMHAVIAHDGILFAVSIIVAVVLSTLALGVKGFVLKRGDDDTSIQSYLLSAAIMGGAVSVMHYTAMSSAKFHSVSKLQTKLSGLPINNLELITAFVCTALLLVLVAASAADKYRQMAVSLSGQVTERIKAEAKLRETHAKLETLVEARTRELRWEIDKRLAEKDKLEDTLIELQRMQKTLVETEKMASLGGLVAGVAHEINTPIGVSVTASSHLNDEVCKLTTLVSSGELKKQTLLNFLVTAQETTRIISANLARSADLVLGFKQVAVDQSNEERRTFKLLPYIEEVLTSLQPKLRVTPHAVVVEGERDIELNSYPGAVAQIITNLIMNSLIHAYDDDDSPGKITITVGHRDDNVHLRYSDDGKGVTPDVQQKIFDPFFTTRRGDGGSGLGMHILYNLITQKLSGTVTCESTPGQGVTFDITIPYGTCGNDVNQHAGAYEGTVA
jgi:NO-binding membrane sensor protein with MHYT domain/nitrogen-specific signal transduction histidine kinase